MSLLDAFNSSICFKKFDSKSFFSLLNFCVISSFSSFVLNLYSFSFSAISCLSSSKAFWCDSFNSLISLSIFCDWASISSCKAVIFSSYSCTTVVCDSINVVFSFTNLSSISLFSLLHFSTISSLASLSSFSCFCLISSISFSSFPMLLLFVSSSRSISFSIWAIFISYSCWILVILVS